LARPRKTVNNSSKRKLKWGLCRASQIERKRPDGDSYKVWRCEYAVYDFKVEPIGGLWECLRYRRYAQGENDLEAERLAERMSKLNEIYCDEMFQPGSDTMSFSDWLGENENIAVSARPTKDFSANKTSQVFPSSKSFDEVAREYMSTRGKYTRDNKYVGLKAQYLRTIENYIRHAAPISVSNLDSLQLPEILSWFKNYLENHVQGSAARFKSWLCQVGRYALNAGYWPKNHFDSLQHVTMGSKSTEKRVWTLNEIDSMFNAAANCQQQAMLVLLRLGLRQAEINGLTESDLLNNDTIRIRYALNEVNVGSNASGHWIPYLDRPKTDASSADKIRIPKIWMETLRESLEKSKAVQIRAWDDEADGVSREHRFVVSNAFGQPWGQSTSNAVLKRLMDRANVFFFLPGEAKNRRRPTLWHSWRYTYASELIAFGANDKEIEINMRHQDAAFSKAVYAQARLENKSLYDPYKPLIQNYLDYNEVICKFDISRREQKRVVEESTQ
jgi:site-specific recombinase XerD